ncbi:hypothetical protein Tco_0003227 [Tanacetum coccineum]
MSESTKRHEENSNLIKEIRASTDAAIRNQGASIKTLEIQIGQMSKSNSASLDVSTTIEADSYPIRRIGSSQYAVSTGQNRTLMYETRQMTIPFPSHLNGASVSDMPLSTYLNLGLGELADRTMKYPKGIAENVLVVLRERMELDLEVRLMGETLVINRSLDPLNGDYIELNDLNEPFELRRTQGDDFMPTIEKGEKFLCFDGVEFLENMDAYRDEGMGDVIFGEPFLREVRIKARRFEGMITIYNGNESVTYQMVRSHPRFKHHTNEQCNKIPPLLKVSDEDKKNGISHPYQKLKGFYKGVLNLGPDYIRDAKTEEWLTRRHISVHEMEW